MIDIKFDFDKDSGALSMNMDGHANFAEIGKDVVCAGASVLGMTVAQAIQIMSDDGRLAKKAHIKIRSGRIRAVAKPKPEYFAEAQHIYYLGEVGFKLLSEAYPGTIKLKAFVPPAEG